MGSEESWVVDYADQYWAGWTTADKEASAGDALSYREALSKAEESVIVETRVFYYGYADFLGEHYVG